jgi:hypothetical protein
MWRWLRAYSNAKHKLKGVVCLVTAILPCIIPHFFLHHYQSLLQYCDEARLRFKKWHTFCFATAKTLALSPGLQRTLFKRYFQSDVTGLWIFHRRWSPARPQDVKAVIFLLHGYVLRPFLSPTTFGVPRRLLSCHPLDTPCLSRGLKEQNMETLGTCNALSTTFERRGGVTSCSCAGQCLLAGM